MARWMGARPPVVGFSTTVLRSAPEMGGHPGATTSLGSVVYASLALGSCAPVASFTVPVHTPEKSAVGATGSAFFSTGGAAGGSDGAGLKALSPPPALFFFRQKTAYELHR